MRFHLILMFSYCRLDWHLLSTATPSINAWLKPSDRFVVSIKKMAKESSMRTAAVMACMMAEALEVQSIHMPIKVTIIIIFYEFVIMNYNPCSFSYR